MAGDVCNGILVGGAFDIDLFERDSEYKQKIRDYILSSSFESVDNAKKYGLSLSAIIEAIPINVRGDFNEENFRRWQQEGLRQYQLNESSTETVRYLRTRANPDIVRAWTACVTKEPYTGLSVFVDNLGDNLVTVSISWIPTPGNSHLPVIRNITVVGGQLKNSSTYSVGTELLIGYRTNVLLVERNNQSNGTVVVDTSEGAAVGSWEPVRPTQCETCHGLRRIDCITCHGERRIVVPGAPDWARRICTTCHGAGDMICPTCQGSGIQTRNA